jgi:hypothetical protein
MIGAMFIPWIGVAWGIRFYKKRDIGSGRAAVISSIVISLTWAAMSVQFTIMLTEADRTTAYILWGCVFGLFVVLDIVYLRMMIFSRWAKRVTSMAKADMRKMEEEE